MVSGPERLAEITAALDDLGLGYLIMGGHAVRYYGPQHDRLTICISLADWDRLPAVAGSSICWGRSNR